MEFVSNTQFWIALRKGILLKGAQFQAPFYHSCFHCLLVLALVVFSLVLSAIDKSLNAVAGTPVVAAGAQYSCRL